MFNDTEDLRRFVPQIHKHFDYENDLKVQVSQAIELYISPYFGQDILNDLQTKYAASNLVDPIELVLYNVLQHAAGYYMYADLLKFNAFNMTPRGPQESISADGNSRPAENYKVNDARRMASQRADMYLDKALEYAEQQISHADNIGSSVLEKWTESQAYQELFSLLVWSYDQLRQHLPSVSSRRILFAARYAFLTVQKTIIAPNLGDELSLLVAAVKDRHTTALPAEYISLLAVVQPVIIYRGMLTAIPGLRIEIEEGGLHFRSYDGPLTKQLSGANDNAIRHFMSQLQPLATAAEADLQKYLQSATGLNVPAQDLSGPDGEEFHGPDLYSSGGSAFF